MSKLIVSPDTIPIPLTVPHDVREIFCQNYLQATHNSGRLFLFAGDQKVEHLNDDFYGKGISPESNNPEHLFAIASSARIGAFATNLGLIARYGAHYQDVPYVIKLNGKTNLIPTSQAEPQSLLWASVARVAAFKKRTGINIVGIGLTVYLGSEHESEMLAAAAQAIYDAHQFGLLTIVWIYPRGKAISNERTPEIIAGAAGVAVCLGADFVKVNPPEATDGFTSAELLKQATQAAGNTRVICSGGPQRNEKEFLQDLYNQIHTGGSMGAAVGRNIHQKNLIQAIKFCEAIAAIVIDDSDMSRALEYLE